MNGMRLDPDKCIACTTCLVHCPVRAVAPEYPGPRFAGPAYERFRLLGLAEDETLHYCSDCKNCDIACPHGVPVSGLLMRARAVQAEKGRALAPRRLRDRMLAHGETLARATGFVPSALRNAAVLNPATRKLLDLFGVSKKAPLPKFAPRTLRAFLKGERRACPEAPGGRAVALFPGCFADIYEPEAGFDLVRLLRKAGYEVLCPDDFVCCGMPMIANGFWEDARRNAAANLGVLARLARGNIPVLAGCPSCRLMFSEELAEFFPELFNGAGAFAIPRVEDAQRFLLECLDRGEFAAPPAPERERVVVYHAPCHLRAQGEGLPGLELLRALPGHRIVEAAAGCCGMSGSYGFKKEKYETGMKVGEDLFRMLRETPADFSSSECGACRLQMRHGSGKTALHPAGVMRRALEGPS
jgi:glycerol-3-phosphate dehydrogenase subunit C